MTRFSSVGRWSATRTGLRARRRPKTRVVGWTAPRSGGVKASPSLTPTVGPIDAGRDRPTVQTDHRRDDTDLWFRWPCAAVPHPEYLEALCNRERHVESATPREAEAARARLGPRSPSRDVAARRATAYCLGQSSAYRRASSRRVSSMSMPVAASFSANTAPHRLVRPMMSAVAAASACTGGSVSRCRRRQAISRSGGPWGWAAHAVMTSMASRTLCSGVGSMTASPNRAGVLTRRVQVSFVAQDCGLAPHASPLRRDIPLGAP